ELFEDYNCYLMDLPGHGNSDITGYNFDNYINAIKGLASKLNNVILVGHSLGGTLALKVSSLGLESVIGQVLLNTSYAWDDLDKDFMAGIYRGEMDVNWLMKAAGHTDNEDVMKALQTMEPLGNTIADFCIDEAIDISDCLDKIKVPTFIFTGGDEIIAYPRYSEKLHEVISDSELAILKGGRHLVCISEKDKIKDMVYDFIDRKILKNSILIINNGDISD
nr:alpha/beta hydrolase [Clostridium sp.]